MWLNVSLRHVAECSSSFGRSEWFQASYVQQSRTENVSGGKIKNIFVAFALARETVTISI